MKKKISQNFLLFIEESLWDLFFFSRANRLQIFFYERKRQRPETEQFFMETDQ